MFLFLAESSYFCDLPLIVRLFFFFQAEDGIRDFHVTGVQTCALPISEKERILPVDTVADGEPVAWGLERLRGRLAPMLTEAGGERLVAALDGDTVARAVNEVEQLVRSEERRVGKGCRSGWWPDDVARK